MIDRGRVCSGKSMLRMSISQIISRYKIYPRSLVRINMHIAGVEIVMEAHDLIHTGINF